jgi:hypothetical protein
MKIFLIAAVVLIVAGSILADYKWRSWIARQRRDRHE